MPGLIRGVARTAVIAGTATAVSNRVSRRQAGRWAAQAEQHEQRSEQKYEQQIADPMEGKIGQLRTLADLRAQGALTDEEFQQQKNAILGG